MSKTDKFLFEVIEIVANLQTPDIKTSYLEDLDEALSQRGLTRTATNEEAKSITFDVTPPEGYTFDHNDVSVIFLVARLSLSAKGYGQGHLISYAFKSDSVICSFIPESHATLAWSMN